MVEVSFRLIFIDGTGEIFDGSFEVIFVIIWNSPYYLNDKLPVVVGESIILVKFYGFSVVFNSFVVLFEFVKGKSSIEESLDDKLKMNLKMVGICF